MPSSPAMRRARQRRRDQILEISLPARRPIARASRQVLGEPMAAAQRDATLRAVRAMARAAPPYSCKYSRLAPAPRASAAYCQRVAGNGRTQTSYRRGRSRESAAQRRAAVGRSGSCDDLARRCRGSRRYSLTGACIVSASIDQPSRRQAAENRARGQGVAEPW